MKQSILMLTCVFIWTLNAFSQEAPQQVKAPSASISESKPNLLPKEKDMGFTVNVAGLIQNISLQPRQDLLSNNLALFRYTYNPSWTFRFGLAPNVYRFNVTTTDSVGKNLVEFDSTASRSMIGFRPGVEYHFKGSNRLDPYVALDMDVGFVGGLRIGSVTNTTDTTGTSRLTRTITEDGGFSIGAKLSAGMNFFLAKGFFVGMEYGLGLNNVVTGGDRQDVVQSEPISGTSQTSRTLSSSRSSNLTFFVDPMAMITIGYFFSSR